MSSIPTTAGKELDVRSHRKDRSIPALKKSALYLYILLRGHWRVSTLRLVVCEVCRFPRRISAILKDSNLRLGPALPNDPRQTGQMSLRQESTFLFASTDYIKQLSKEYPWMGSLDQQLAGKAYQEGAALAFRISYKESDDTVFGHP